MQNHEHPAAAALGCLWKFRLALETSNYPVVRSPSHDTIRELIAALRTELIANGVPASAIRTEGRIELPGAYDDVARRWDLLVMDDSDLIAAVDVRMQTGPSASNNARNRMSDIVATAANFGRAYTSSDQRAFRPFLGLVFAMEATPETAQRRPALAGGTYLERFGDFFRRLMDAEMYDAICYLTADGPDPVVVNEPDPAMGFEVLARTIANHVTAFRRLREQNHDPAAASIALRLSSLNNLSEVISALNDIVAGHAAVEEAERGVTSTGL